MTEPVVYSPAEVAELLRVHEETVRRWLIAGSVPGRKVGGLWLVSAVRLHAWLELRDEETDRAAARLLEEALG